MDTNTIENALQANQNSRIRPGIAAADVPHQHGSSSRSLEGPSCSTGKTRFTTEALAQRRLEALAGRPAPDHLYVPVSVYHCRKCVGWHLTSKSRKPRARGKQPR